MSSNIIKDKINNRNVSIDIIRGCCILFVILLHLNIHFNFSNTFLKEILPKKLFSLLFWSGFYGVVVFFTLSGYLITSSILKRWKTLSKINIKAFFWLRFSRIIPLLVALLLVLSVFHLMNVQGFIINAEKTSLSRLVFATLTFHINWLQIYTGYLPANWDVLWSISIEESFYFIFPFVCLFLKKEWHFVFILLIFIIISPWARTSLFVGNELGDRNHLAFLDSIALGVMSAIIAFRINIPKWLNLSFLIIGLLMISLVLVFRSLLFHSGLVQLGLNVTILSLGISLILLWIHKKHHLQVNKKRQNHFNLLRNMGIYSYEIYLTHMFAIIFCARIFKYLQLGTYWLIPFSLFAILISYFLGYLIFTYFSEPINLWLRKRF